MWEEKFWLVTSILNSALGLHIMLRVLFSSWSSALPIFGAVAIDLYLTLSAFSRSYRNKNYFRTKPKILVSLCLQIIVVSLSEWMFTFMGYKKLVRLACLVHLIPGFWAILRRPCPAQLKLPVDQHFLSVGLWAFWLRDDSYIGQLVVGFYMFGQSSELFTYHLYMEADRIMHNREYYEWLLQKIRTGAFTMCPMFDDLFRARGVNLTDIYRSD